MNKPSRSRFPHLVLATLLAVAAGHAGAVGWAELPPGALVVQPQAVASMEPRAEALAAGWSAALGSPANLVLPDPAGFDDQQQLIVQVLAEARLVRWLARRPELGESALDQLAGRLPVLWMRHEETAADWFVPLVDVGALARSARAERQLRRNASGWQQRLLKDAGKALARLPEAGSDDARGLRMALEAAPPEMRARWVRRLDSRDAASLPWDLALAAAELSPEPARIARALSLAPPGQRAMLLQRVDALLPPSQAEAVFGQWLSDPELASVAVLGLGRLASKRPGILEQLLDWLADPRLGDSAAAALAAPRDGRHVAALVQRIEGADALTLQRIALGLRLDGSAAAGAGLQRLLDAPALDAGVREELGR